MPISCLLLDPDFRITDWNPACEQTFGFTRAEVFGRQATEVIAPPSAHESVRGVWRRFLAGEDQIRGVNENVTKQGRRILCEWYYTRLVDPDGNMTGVLAMGIDVTEKKQLEARFLRAQRLESVGTLVSGIAHDLNNMLTPVLMAVKLLKKNKPGLDRADLLDTAQTSAERGVGLVRQLLTFAGGENGGKISVQLKDVVNEVITLLDHTLPKSIAIRHEWPDSPLTVRGDPTQITQILMNLSVNARDAMPDGGTLTVSVAQNRLNAYAVERYPGARAGAYVVISVTDTGTGIPPDVQEKMFDPFFTTKPFGRGTGLGLSTVLGIVKSHGGFVNVYSELDRGTKICVFLPADASEEELAEVARPSVPEPGRGECILVVDDEKPILAMVKATLEAHNYRVLAANGGTEAIALFHQHRSTIRLVLIDMMMPELDGPVVMAAIRNESADIQVVAASGLRPTGRYADSIVSANARFLPKPYSDDDLLTTIANLLNRPPVS